MGFDGDVPRDGETEEAALELVRVIDRTDFVSPTDYDREKEFVIRNNTSSAKNYIFLPLGNFLLNLEVFDEDGTKLNYFPNDEVEDILAEIKAESPGEFHRIQERFSQSKYKLFVQLPPDNPVGPDELRTIRLTFGQSEQPRYHRLWERPWLTGWITHWKQKFFRIPSFIARATRRPGRSHSELFVVEGPSEYVTVGKKSSDLTEMDKFYENGYGADTRVLSTHLPPADENGYTWSLNYDLVPNNTGLLRLLAGFWTISTATAILLLFCVQLPLFTGSVETKMLSLLGFTPEMAGRSISTGVLSITAGVIYALRAEWAERYRILSVVPIVLHGVSWIFWAIIETSGG